MNIFRKKSIDRVSDPDQLYDYIRVTTPGMWLVLLALVILLLGILAWSVFGTVEAVSVSGTAQVIHPIELVVN